MPYAAGLQRMLLLLAVILPIRSPAAAEASCVFCAAVVQTWMAICCCDGACGRALGCWLGLVQVDGSARNVPASQQLVGNKGAEETHNAGITS